jgi:KipI family sensor histidine kinase inhibitor
MILSPKSSSPESPLYPEPRILLCGDTGISVEFGNEIDLKVNRRVQHLYRTFKVSESAGILDIIPAYRSLFIQYDPWICSLERLLLIVEQYMSAIDTTGPDAAEIKEIPVCYENDFGLDILEVAEFHGMTAEKVIELHTAPVYDVYMIGFVLGFPYLGGLDERLYTPRKKNPRKIVPAGSVGIADRQTGIYPIQSPGGWQVLGKTPVRLFDLERENPFFVEMGDKIRFRPITRAEFESYTNH